MTEAFDYTSPPPRELLEHYGVPEDVIDGVFCMHAHELAEKIRLHWYPKFPGKSEYTQGVDDGYDKAADLIDPEVD